MEERHLGAPLFKGLTRPLMIKGVPYDLFLAELMVSVALLFGGMMVYKWIWFGLPFVYLFHVLMRQAHRRDQDFMRIYLFRYSRQGDVYDPWPSLNPKRGLRPEGFGSRRWLR